MQDLPQYQHIHAQAKVMHAGEAFKLCNGGKVQEAIIVGATGHVILNI